MAPSAPRGDRLSSERADSDLHRQHEWDRSVGAYKNSVKGRHYCRDLNFLRDLIKGGVIRLVHVSGYQNHSDILTKDLGYEKFASFARTLMQGQE
jgi:3-deoxy-D-arabino-heptulosonate 7-phosphate (DAHP) synthase class II